AGTASAQVANFKPRLGCIPFMATSLQAMAFTENISSSLLDSIDKTGHFEVVERKKVEHFIEIEGQRLDNLNHDGIVRVGLKAGLDYAVHGSVSMTDSGASLEVNLIAVRSKKTLMKGTFRISESDFTRQLQSIAATIVERVKQAVQESLATPEVVQVVVPQPRNISVSGTSTSIRLTWQMSDMEQIAGFNIYRSVHPDGPFSLHGTTTEPMFVDDRLKLNEVFYYRISAVNRAGIGCELTAAVRGATVIAPPAPIFLNVQPDIKGARLSWRPRPGAGSVSSTVPAAFKIYRKNESDNTLVMVVQLPVESIEYYDGDLKDGIKYIYTITACNSEGAESEMSARLSVVPLHPPKQVRPLSNLIRQIPIGWDAYGGESAEGYVLYRSDSRDGSYARIAKLDLPATVSYTDKKLADNTTYWYRLSAYKKGGIETDPSEPVSAKTRDVPPKPAALTADSGQPRKVTLRWQNVGVAEDEITQVLIFRSLTSADMKFETIGEVRADMTSFVDDSRPLLDKTSYSYRISSQNSGGALSPMTDSAAATTKSPPEAPAGFAVKSGLVKKATVSWQRNRENDINEYHVARKQAGDPEYREIGITADTVFEDLELADGAEVSYKVRAFDRDGLVSGYSDAVSARTKPLPARVAGLRIADQASRSLEWQANREVDVLGYVIYKKGFLGVAQKQATVSATSWKPAETREKAEYYVTALDAAGLESPPSESVSFE
ncbi:MAG: hypothetical protein V1791_01620, partial [Pseudomonadota bacterium]